jgi:hypothetical protein
MVRSLPVMFGSAFQDVSCRDCGSLVFHLCEWFTQTVCVCVCVCVCVENAGERGSGKLLVLERGKDTGRSPLCLIRLHEIKAVQL